VRLSCARGSSPILGAIARGAVPVPEWHRGILDERLKDYEANPKAGESWDVVRERLRDNLP